MTELTPPEERPGSRPPIYEVLVVDATGRPVAKWLLTENPGKLEVKVIAR